MLLAINAGDVETFNQAFLDMESKDLHLDGPTYSLLIVKLGEKPAFERLKKLLASKAGSSSSSHTKPSPRSQPSSTLSSTQLSTPPSPQLPNLPRHTRLPTAPQVQDFYEGCRSVDCLEDTDRLSRIAELRLLRDTLDSESGDSRERY